MRYADGGGLTAAGRERREVVRIQAAELFERGVKAPEVARQLRVSPKSAYHARVVPVDGTITADARERAAGRTNGRRTA
ncbi:helix-turn-helix domain-containing protein [Streptomyces gelaticus]|uniref:helix-turn-helix domain-containing protein n=1 Tax=Streptomyces gelaticus TaxID=285446 RepID=UPI0037B37DE9